MNLSDIRGSLGLMSEEGRQELEREAAERGISVEHHFIDCYLAQTGGISQQLYSLRSEPERPQLRAVEK